MIIVTKTKNMYFYNGNDDNNILLIETIDCNIFDNSQLQPLTKN